MFSSSTLKALVTATALSLFSLSAEAIPRRYDSVGDYIRTLPYQALKSGSAARWRKFRREILSGRGVCRDRSRQVFFDLNGGYKAYITETASSHYYCIQYIYVSFLVYTQLGCYLL